MKSPAAVRRRARTKGAFVADGAYNPIPFGHHRGYANREANVDSDPSCMTLEVVDVRERVRQHVVHAHRLPMGRLGMGP